LLTPCTLGQAQTKVQFKDFILDISKRRAMTLFEGRLTGAFKPVTCLGTRRAMFDAPIRRSCRYSRFRIRIIPIDNEYSVWETLCSKREGSQYLHAKWVISENKPRKSPTMVYCFRTRHACLRTEFA